MACPGSKHNVISKQRLRWTIRQSTSLKIKWTKVQKIPHFESIFGKRLFGSTFFENLIYRHFINEHSFERGNCQKIAKILRAHNQPKVCEPVDKYEAYWANGKHVSALPDCCSGLDVSCHHPVYLSPDVSTDGGWDVWSFFVKIYVHAPKKN